MTANLALAKEISTDAAETTDLLELDDIVTFKEEQRMAMKALLGGKYVFLFFSMALARV